MLDRYFYSFFDYLGNSISSGGLFMGIPPHDPTALAAIYYTDRRVLTRYDWHLGCRWSFCDRSSPPLLSPCPHLLCFPDRGVALADSFPLETYKHHFSPRFHILLGSSSSGLLTDKSASHRRMYCNVKKCSLSLSALCLSFYPPPPPSLPLFLSVYVCLSPLSLFFLSLSVCLRTLSLFLSLCLSVSPSL